MRGNATARVSMQFFVVTRSTTLAGLWRAPDGAIDQAIPPARSPRP